MAVLQMTIKRSWRSATHWIADLSHGSSIRGNWKVDWGDGWVEYDEYEHDYNYAEGGTYQVTVEGDFKIENMTMPYYLVSLDRIEDCGVTDLSDFFEYCYYLEAVPHDWDLSEVVNTSRMFKKCSYFNQDLSHWDLSHIKKKVNMFKNCKSMESKNKPRGLRKGDKKC